MQILDKFQLQPHRRNVREFVGEIFRDIVTAIVPRRDVSERHAGAKSASLDAGLAHGGMMGDEIVDLELLFDESSIERGFSGRIRRGFRVGGNR